MTSYSEQFALRKAAQAEVMGEEVDPQPFDLDEFRAELERRRVNLNNQERQYYSKYLGGGRASDLRDANRAQDKARGIEIALSLLPLVEVAQ